MLPETAETIVDTPRRSALLRAAADTAGKLPRRQLFKRYGIPDRTGYRIIKEGTNRRSQRIHNRGRKPLLNQSERQAIETVEDASFRFGSSSHYAIASAIGLAHGTERAIQRNMKDYGVETFRAKQRRRLLNSTKEKRELWAFERRYWKIEQFQQYRYSDESHFATLLQRLAFIHSPAR